MSVNMFLMRCIKNGIFIIKIDIKKSCITEKLH